MKQAPQSAPARVEENEQALRIYRSLAVTGALVVPGFGVVRRIIDPLSQDPFLERLAISMLLLGFAALTLVQGPVRRNPDRSIAVVLYLVSAGVIHLGAQNGLSANTAFGYLIMLFACSLAFRTREMLALYLSSATLTIALTLYVTPGVAVDPLFFLASVVAVSLLTYSVQANRLAVESDLRDARDLAEAAVRTRSRFLANMSHEIRTPMNGVIGMVSLLEDTELSATQRDYLRTIRTSGDTLLLLINDILDFSKIEAGQVAIERAPFDPAACLEDAADMVTPAAREKGLELVCECSPALPGEVLGDSLRLRQILVNLLSNAVKFTERGEVHAYVHGVREGAGRYRLYGTVRDTGIGIPADKVGGLFQAFAQVDSSTTRRYGGTGLGLSICRQLAERMDGSIRVETTEGRGAAFHFNVSLGTSGTAAVRSWPPLPAGRALIVEGNATTAGVIKRYLEARKLCCSVARSEQAAAQELARSRFDLVLAGGSAEWVQRLRRRNPGDGGATHWLRLAPMNESRSGGAAEASGVLYRPLRREALYRALPGAEPAPRAVGQATAPQGSVMPQSHGRAGEPLRILLVEDNPVNQRVALKMLEHLGHAAELAGDGAEAVAAVTARSFDLVLMDLQMPVMDGLEAARRIRALPSGADLHIVAMTANAMPSDREACAAAGMNDCLCKPVRMELLRDLLAPLPARAWDEPAVAPRWRDHAGFW